MNPISFVQSLFSDGASKLVKETTDGLNGLFTSDEERLKAQTVLETNVQSFITSMMAPFNQAMEAVSARHKNDMLSDSWLSKNIRPLFLIFICVNFTIVLYWPDKTNPTVLNMLNDWGVQAIAFYFCGRDVVKLSKGALEAFMNYKNKKPQFDWPK